MGQKTRKHLYVCLNTWPFGRLQRCLCWNLKKTNNVMYLIFLKKILRKNLKQCVNLSVFIKACILHYLIIMSYFDTYDLFLDMFTRVFASSHKRQNWTIRWHFNILKVYCMPPNFRKHKFWPCLIPLGYIAPKFFTCDVCTC